MKKIYIFLIAFIPVICSCNDWNLNLTSTKPNYQGTGTAAVIRGQLVTAYNLLMTQQGGIFSDNYWGSVGCIDTDEGFRANVSNNSNILNAHNITSSTNQLIYLWKFLWQSNESATNVLTMLKTVKDMDADEMKQVEGQALVLQAFDHYYAAINFGPVPIKTVSTFDMDNDVELTRMPVKDVLQFALDNCRKAIPLLPDITSTKTTASITKSAAEALSYRIALYMASHPDIKDVAKYDSIVGWADKFITTGPNKLNTNPLTVNGETVPAYARLFVNNMANNAVWDATNNPEGIWDIIFYCKSTTSGIYANLGYEKAQRLGRDMGVPCPDNTTTSVIGYADNTYRASNNLYNAYTDFNHGVDYPIGDLRRDWNIPTFCYKYKGNDASIPEGYSTSTRFPYFDVLLPSTITYKNKAVLLPLFDKSTWNNSDSNANLIGIYVEDGGSGYTNAQGQTTFDVTIPKTASNFTSMKFYDATKGAVVAFSQGANIDKKAAGYESVNAKNNSADVTVHVTNGSITSITSKVATIGSSFPCVHAYGVGKWRREYEVNVPPVREQDYTSCNVPVLRFADVLLMAAEAHLMASNGDKAKGLEYLNMVRRRAYGVSVNTPNSTVDFKELNLQVIKDERMRELCFEGVRRFDLLRWGAYTATDDTNVITQFLAQNPNHNNIIYPIVQLRDNFLKFQYLPIPQDEISFSPNTMWQNPGW
jgi:hypothetical protein